jgi:xanthine dehydrogenase molybdopterin-binding subunit B
MAAAVVAAKLGRSVRVMLDRDEDMLMTGHRNPFMAKYKVGFNNDGVVKAVDVSYVSPRFIFLSI